MPSHFIALFSATTVVEASPSGQQWANGRTLPPAGIHASAKMRQQCLLVLPVRKSFIATLFLYLGLGEISLYFVCSHLTLPVAVVATGALGAKAAVTVETGLGWRTCARFGTRRILGKKLFNSFAL